MRGSKDLVWRQGTPHAPSDADEAVETTVEAEAEAEAVKTTVDRPDWRWNLHPHWDWNPWVYQAMVDRGLPRMYQGIIALDDCPEEVGGHVTIPGSAAYLPHWVPTTFRQRRPLLPPPLFFSQ
jgi:ectoine hydroxylase-related dioxygenase (phytanoyl-CoA dioxygenase family)